MTPDIFLHHIINILYTQDIIQSKSDYSKYSDMTSSEYTKYKTRAEEKNLAFELSKEEFFNLQENNCYLCDRLSENTRKNGIDRIDNNLGYTLDNTASCCSDCNYMKRDHNLQVFLDHLYKIYENVDKSLFKRSYECKMNWNTSSDRIKPDTKKIQTERKISRLNNLIERYNVEEITNNNIRASKEASEAYLKLKASLKK